ncbi:hypothetical protein BS17DRAFT_776454 [Gyrodon lividus]|nr:hypothetical protein BS17DRAFT_776454 [Gyrodon lividus]
MCLALESRTQGLFAISVDHKYTWGSNYANHLYFVVQTSVQSCADVHEGLEPLRP